MSRKGGDGSSPLRLRGRSVSTTRPTAQSSSGRLVTASRGRSGSAHTVLVAHLGHAQALRMDRVGAPRGDVGATVLLGQPGRRHRAQPIGEERRVGAGEGARAGRHPVAPQPGGGEKLAEENELAQRGDRGVGIPFDVEAPSVGIDRQRPVQAGTSGEARRGAITSPGG